MGFMDELKKLTQPYDDDDDFFEGASESERSSAAAVSAAQQQVESAFGEESVSAAEPAEKKSPKRGEGGGLFGAFGARRAEKKPRAPLRERTVNFGGSDTQVILFNPKTFDEAGELVGHMLRSAHRGGGGTLALARALEEIVVIVVRLRQFFQFVHEAHGVPSGE